MWNQLDQTLLTISSKIPTIRDSVMPCKKPERSTYESVITASNRYSTVDSDYCDYETIRSITQRIHKGSHDITANSEDGVVPILNTAVASFSDVHTLLSLFMSDISESVTKEELVIKLSKFIPTTTVQLPHTKVQIDDESCSSCTRRPDQKLSACYQCSNHCPLEVYRHPRIGSHQLCAQCVADITKEDANDWGKASIRFLANSDTDSIVASLGCASVAMALGANSYDLLQNMAKELHNHGHHELAFNVTSPLLAKSNDEASNKQQLKLHLLASSILKSLAQGYQRTLEEKLSFALASKEAYSAAMNITARSNIEISGNRERDIENLVHQLHELKKGKHDELVSQYTENLESLWKRQDFLGVLSYLKEISSLKSDIGGDPSLKAFEKFLTTKERELFMLPSNHHALQFLRCVLHLKEKEVDSGLADLELVAWNSPHSNISIEAIIGVYLHVLGDQKSRLYSYATLKDVLQSGSKTLLFSPPQKVEEKSQHLLFPSDSELNPPFRENWPAFSAAGSESRCHRKYEKAVLKNYDEKRWTEMDVAWAYVDEIPGCTHPAEMVVCHLHAAMWMAKQLDPKTEIDSSTLCGLKCIIMKLLKTAFSIAVNFLNPGMQLYVIRLVIGIMRKLALMPDSKLVLKDEDTAYLQVLLKKLVKLSQLFPFWEPPAVSVSEAVMLSIITANLHSSFIFGLQILNPAHSPLTNTDLKYQLYENDLLSILPLENSSDSHARAMEDLLKSQGRSWNDVVQTMSSPLTLRDSQGWIIQSPDLGVPQQYSEMTGFVIDTRGGHPSIKLLVVEADPRNGRMGLFSQEDISTMIQLDNLQMQLFFSLDPPDHDFDKRFHPFQQWRYATEKIKDTEVLKTMFTADYLMKSFTVGSDVSALPPFKQRPCEKGLTKDLPQKLKEAIRSIDERGGIQSMKISSAYRFWIEAKEMKYSLQQNGSKIECHFGEMEMIVKCHSLVRHNDGKLSDSDEDFSPHTPQAQFAKDMTDNYTELGHYFPVFARLQQLSKLQVFVNMLQPILKGLNPFESYSSINSNQPSSCKWEWVPAAVSDTKRSISYGGVSFNPKLTLLAYGERLPWSGNETLVTIQGKSKVAVQTSRVDFSAPKGNAKAKSSNNTSNGSDEGGSDDENGDDSSSGGSAQFTRAAVLAAAAALTGEYDKENEQDRLLETDLTLKNCNAITTPPSSKQRIFGFTLRERNLPLLNNRLDIFFHGFYNDTEAAIAPTSQPKGGTAASQASTASSQPPRSTTVSRPSTTSSSKSTSQTTGGLATSQASSQPTSQPKAETAASQSSNTSQQLIVGTKSSQSHKTSSLPTSEHRGGRSKPSSGRSKPSGGSRLPVKGSKSSSGGVDHSGGDHDGSVPTGIPPGGGENPPEEKPKRGYITGCDAKRFISCRSPESIIPEIMHNGYRYPEGGQDRTITGKERINGLYVLTNKKTGEIYIGRSCDVLRRNSEHQNDIEKDKNTVGKSIPSVDDMEFCIIPLPPDFSTVDMRFYEQLLLSKAKHHGYKVMNKIRAMKNSQFVEETKNRGEKSYPEHHPHLSHLLQQPTHAAVSSELLESPFPKLE